MSKEKQPTQGQYDQLLAAYQQQHQEVLALRWELAEMEKRLMAVLNPADLSANDPFENPGGLCPKCARFPEAWNKCPATGCPMHNRPT